MYLFAFEEISDCHFGTGHFDLDIMFSYPFAEGKKKNKNLSENHMN